MLATRPDFNDQRFYNDLLPLRTEEAIQFIDLTAWVGETVRRSGVGHGYVQIQVLHTTAAIIANATINSRSVSAPTRFDPPGE